MTIHESERPMLLDQLAAKLLRSCPPGTWRALFLEGGDAGVYFARRRVTLVHVAGGPGSDRDARELAWLAASFRGVEEPSGCEPGKLFRFDGDRSAIRLALALQRTPHLGALSIGVVTCDCTIAHFRLADRAVAVICGDEDERAADMARQAAAGTIALCAHTCGHLDEFLDEEVGAGLITREFDGDHFRQATVTLPPHPAAAYSSFAGLGMV